MRECRHLNAQIDKTAVGILIEYSCPECGKILNLGDVQDRIATSNADRFNDGKVDLTLVPTEANKAEARVWGFGADKYGRDNWKKLWGNDTVNVVMASLLRHSYAILEGEINDPESGEQHAAHIRCNAAMLIEYFSKK
jgi:hypothetical protein